MNKLTALAILKLTQFPCEKIAVIGTYNKVIDDARVALIESGWKSQIVAYTKNRLLINGGGELLFFDRTELDLKLCGYRFDKIIVQGSKKGLLESDLKEIIYPSISIPKNFRIIQTIREECRDFPEDLLFHALEDSIFFTESC